MLLKGMFQVKQALLCVSLWLNFDSQIFVLYIFVPARFLDAFFLPAKQIVWPPLV